VSSTTNYSTVWSEVGYAEHGHDCELGWNRSVSKRKASMSVNGGNGSTNYWRLIRIRKRNSELTSDTREEKLDSLAVHKLLQ